jgi:hypothetical protein
MSATQNNYVQFIHKWPAPSCAYPDLQVNCKITKMLSSMYATYLRCLDGEVFPTPPSISGMTFGDISAVISNMYSSALIILHITSNLADLHSSIMHGGDKDASVHFIGLYLNNHHEQRWCWACAHYEAQNPPKTSSGISPKSPCTSIVRLYFIARLSSMYFTGFVEWIHGSIYHA